MADEVDRWLAAAGLVCPPSSLEIAAVRVVAPSSTTSRRGAGVGAGAPPVVTEALPAAGSAAGDALERALDRTKKRRVEGDADAGRGRGRGR